MRAKDSLTFQKYPKSSFLTGETLDYYLEFQRLCSYQVYPKYGRSHLPLWEGFF